MSGTFAFPADNGLVTFNAPELQATEIPAANGISSAQSLALLYSAARGGETMLWGDAFRFHRGRPRS
ncbi:MAG TPA: hypothetical protein VF148_04695 [Acidimicrobiia bacterium]